MAYLFIGGSQRTGTSIMQQLLCQLPSTNPYVYEASYLRNLVECYCVARDQFTSNHASYFGNLQGLRGFNSGVVHAFLSYAQSRLGNCEHLLLKEPHLTLFWPDLFELVPEAIFMIMIRDPRDAIASMVEVGQRQKAIGQNYVFVKRDIPQLCEHFLSFYAPSFNQTNEEFRERLAIVHYEKLVTDPRQMLTEIAGFTGLPFDEIDPFQPLDTGHVQNKDTTASEHYSPWVTNVSGQGLSASRIGNFRKVLTASEIAIIEDRCGQFFEWFEYSQNAA